MVWWGLPNVNRVKMMEVDGELEGHSGREVLRRARERYRGRRLLVHISFGGLRNMST